MVLFHNSAVSRWPGRHRTTGAWMSRLGLAAVLFHSHAILYLRGDAVMGFSQLLLASQGRVRSDVSVLHCFSFFLSFIFSVFLPSFLSFCLSIFLSSFLSFFLSFFPSCHCDRLVGLVVKAPASRPEDQGFHSRLLHRVDFPGRVIPVTYKIGTPMATLRGRISSDCSVLY